MTSLQEPLSAYQDPWERINAWPENKPMKTKEVAIFTRLSVSTLSRMRIAGTGPDYFQGGMRSDGSIPSQAAGTNQHVLYFKKDIQAWWAAGKVSSTIMAAIKKGQLKNFATLADIAEEQPYYMDPQGRIEACVEDVAMETVLERLGVWEIEWLPPVNAASRVWSDPQAQRGLVSAFKRILSDSIQAIDAGAQATELDQEIKK